MGWCGCLGFGLGLGNWFERKIAGMDILAEAADIVVGLGLTGACVYSFADVRRTTHDRYQ